MTEFLFYHRRELIAMCSFKMSRGAPIVPPADYRLINAQPLLLISLLADNSSANTDYRPIIGALLKMSLLI